jgi:hypothetical protein
MNVSSLFFASLVSALRRLFLKAGAKVQLLFKPASFFKKKFSFFQAAFSKFQVLNLSQFLAVWEGKDKFFFLYNPSLFETFFSAISNSFIRVKTAVHCV